MRKNIDFVAYVPRSGSSWTFYLVGKAEKVSEVTDEILDIIKKVLDINNGFFIPTKIEYSLITESEDFTANSLFGTRIEPLDRFPREIKSDNGISSYQFKMDVQSIETPKDVVRYIHRIKMDGKTRFVLDGRDEYIDGKSKGLYAIICDGKVLDEQLSIGPLMIDVQQSSLKDESKSVEIANHAYYKIIFRTYTDMWFEDTQIGLANRSRLRRVLKGVYDSFDVTGTLFMSDHFSEKTLKEVVFGEE